MSQLEKKYSWSERIENSNFEITTSDKIIELLSQASEEDRKQVLKIFTNLLGKDYSKDMVENHEPQGDKVEAEMNIFRKIFASLDEENLQEQYDFLKSAMDDEDEDDESEESEDDEDEDEDDDEKEASYESDIVKDSSFDQLMQVIASWKPEDRKAVFEIFKGLLGDKYSNDSVKDYIPKGKARDVSSPQSSGQVESSSKDNVKTASKKDRKEVSNLYRNLFGSKFVDKMVALYEPKGKKSTTETSGQTKTSSFDPWGLKTSKKEYNEYAICTDSVGREDEAKYKRCKEKVKEQYKNKNSKPLKKNEEE